MKRGSERFVAMGALVLVSVYLVACGTTSQSADSEPPTAIPTVAAPATPTVELLPDLVISNGSMALEGYSQGCVAEIGSLLTTVCVLNQGEGDAGPFSVRVLHRQGGDAFTWEVEGLEAGVELCFEAVGRATGRATVDLNDEVAETDEANNNSIVPLTTPPPVCTPTSVPTNTPEPLPHGEPTATPFPEGSKIETEVFPVYNCVYLGNEIYEWYRVEVTYLNGEPVSEEVIRGPYQGEWQGGCDPNPGEPQS